MKKAIFAAFVILLVSREASAGPLCSLGKGIYKVAEKGTVLVAKGAAGVAKGAAKVAQFAGKYSGVEEAAEKIKDALCAI